MAWVPLGVPWEALGGALGALRRALGVLRGNLGRLDALLGSLWAALGRHRYTLSRVLRVKIVAEHKKAKLGNKSYKERNRHFEGPWAGLDRLCPVFYVTKPLLR